ncbi:MAG: hypothetical protein ACLSVD_18385 [Eggerthellaceae bacterium]
MSLNTMELTRRSFVKGAEPRRRRRAERIAGLQARQGVRRNCRQRGRRRRGRRDGHCRMCMLCGSCSFVATMKDGVVVNIEGDRSREQRRHARAARAPS